MNRVRDSARVQWGIFLGLAPIVALFFGELSLVAPLVNFFAIPLFSLVLVPLTLLGAVSLYSDSLGPLVIQIPGQLIESVWALLALVSGWRWAAIDLPYINVWSLVLATAGVALALPVHPLPGRYLSGLAILPLIFGRTSGPDPGVVTATVLDVGHGLAIIVETENYLLLYDAGPRFRSGFDSGREIVLPAIHTLGRSDVDTIVISHSDSDHSGGAEVVIERFPQAQVIAGPDVELPGVSVCGTGRSWGRDGVRFEFQHPPVGFDALGNDSSCVLKVSTNAGSLLIPGDVEARGENSLADRALDLQSDVVIVPHHGSSTSSSQSFVNAVNAEFAVVSSAYSNQWDFPRPDVRSRWEQSGARVLTTGEGGAYTITLGSSRGIELECWRDRRRRYWQR